MGKVTERDAESLDAKSSNARFELVLSALSHPDPIERVKGLRALSEYLADCLSPIEGLKGLVDVTIKAAMDNSREQQSIKDFDVVDCSDKRARPTTTPKLTTADIIKLVAGD